VSPQDNRKPRIRSTWALLLPSKNETSLHNIITVMTFGGWFVFMLTFIAGIGLRICASAQVFVPPSWLGFVGLGGVASFLTATALHPLFVSFLPKLYYRTGV
jgi:hypothetical protein